MSLWALQASAVGGQTEAFFSTLSKEEKSKRARLRWYAANVGLPIYEQQEFILPHEAGACIEELSCGQRGGDWKIGLKITDSNNRVLVRRLGIDLTEAIDLISRAPIRCIVQTTPYKLPEISGTIWKRGDYFVAELVRGPHYWLTKWSASDESVVRGFASAFLIRLRVEGCSDQELPLFARLMHEACRAVSGVRWKEFMSFNPGVYAEFHWWRKEGMRFIECTSSDAWTGIGANC